MGTEASRGRRGYRVYGLAVCSDIELAGWPSAEVREPDVRICLGTVSAPEPPEERYRAAGHVEPGKVLLAVRGVARYSVIGGSTIIVDAESGATPEDVRLYLLGSMFGTLLHQRGKYPLHASAVEINDRGVAFAGPSGAGKSTMVAQLSRRGAHLITDDISVIEPLGEDEVGVWPSVARVKLDLPGLEALNETHRNLGPAGGNRNKFHLPIERRDESRPIPLRRLYVLQDSPDALWIEPLSGMNATQAVIDETYFLGFVGGLGLTKENFLRAASVARAVKICRLHRPRGFEHLQRVAELVEADIGRE